ncbi:MAG: hypothetical protein ACRD0K_01595 [Egibacteraceae bacterium]
MVASVPLCQAIDDARAQVDMTFDGLRPTTRDDAASVVDQIFDEADRRDPGRQRAWVALVDDNNHQIGRIQAEAKACEVNVTIVCDLIHVLEYLYL